MNKGDARMEQMKKEAFAYLDRNKDEIAKVGDAIFYFGELGNAGVQDFGIFSGCASEGGI